MSSFINLFLSDEHKLHNLGYKIDKLTSIAKLKKKSDIYNKVASILPENSRILSQSNGTVINKFVTSKKTKLSFSEEMMLSDIKSYLVDDILVKLDRSAMSESIEARAPFLAKDIFTYAWKIPENMKLGNIKGKLILREILEDYIPKNLLQQPKMGFAIPLDKWLRGPL